MSRPSNTEKELIPILQKYLGKPGKVSSTLAHRYCRGTTTYSFSTVSLHYRRMIGEMVANGRAVQLHYGLYKIL
jgi:hypothetical protein